MNPILTSSQRSISKFRDSLGPVKLRKFLSWLKLNHPTDYRNNLAEPLQHQDNTLQLQCDPSHSSEDRSKQEPGQQPVRSSPAASGHQHHLCTRGKPSTSGVLPTANNAVVGTATSTQATAAPRKPTNNHNDTNDGVVGCQWCAVDAVTDSIPRVLRTPGLWDETGGYWSSESQDKTDQNEGKCSLESSFMLPIREPDVSRVSGGNLPREIGDMEDNHKVLDFVSDFATVSEAGKFIVAPHDLSHATNIQASGSKVENEKPDLPQSDIKSLITPARIMLKDSSSINSFTDYKLMKERSGKGKQRGLARQGTYTPKKSTSDKENKNNCNTAKKGNREVGEIAAARKLAFQRELN
jgi:hypothetical protein